MAAKKIGTIIKEARTKKGLTQAQLAEAVDGLSASDISKIERGEKIPTAAQAKQMAKPLGVTQISLIEALPAAAKTTAEKADTAKTAAKTTAKTAAKTTAKPAAKTTAKTTAKKTAAKTAGKTSTAKKTSSTGTSVKLTATEKKLVEAYRSANSTTKKAALNLLSGKMGLEDITAILLAAKNSSEGGSTSSSNSGSGSAVSSVLQNIFGKLMKSGPENAPVNPFDQVLQELQAASPKENADELVLLDE